MIDVVTAGEKPAVPAVAPVQRPHKPSPEGDLARPLREEVLAPPQLLEGARSGEPVKANLPTTIIPILCFLLIVFPFC